MRRKRHLLTAALEGAAAGAAATWLMGRVTSLLYAREADGARHREDAARGGKTAYGVAAEKAARVAGRELSNEESERLGGRMHWATGIAAGTTYALLARRFASVGTARGLAFGLAFFLAVDEVANWALGFTPGPTAFPWQAHARGLAGHLAFGVATDTTLRGLDAALPQ